jgi:galactose oxidase
MGVLHLARRFRRSSVLVAAAALLPLALLLVPGSARPVASVAAPSSASESASASSHEVKPTVAAYVPDAPTLGRRGWTASASDATTGHPATSVLDANAFTYWESPLPSPSNGNGASITLELPSPQVVSGIIYEPRQGASPVGAIGHFTTTSMGTWADTTGVKEVGIAAVSTRFVRLTALTNASGSRADIAAAELYLLGTPHVSANLTASVSSGSAATPAVSTNPAVVGQWGPVIGFPLVPVAAALLPHNELLVWSADGDVSFGASGANYTQTAILNLTTGAVSALEVSNTNHNMFCPGVAILANGDIMVTGGLSDQQTSIYSPATNTWSAGPQMNIGRGYQAMTLLSNGQAFTLGGSWSGGLGGKLGEI